ncbi:uncharacterized protein RSE6_15043 [Rhynchosporium secalis]|uniref:Uncharacterized protein n=1 Tax=Rhynchosporium secalis TaxID=38038 RepID=A0A1E1MWL4_RHYSE|nr:uncharacterized protein RSE6_15043 [Rhynchosporium secalis]
MDLAVSVHGGRMCHQIFASDHLLLDRFLRQQKFLCRSTSGILEEVMFDASAVIAVKINKTQNPYQAGRPARQPMPSYMAGTASSIARKKERGSNAPRARVSSSGSGTRTLPELQLGAPLSSALGMTIDAPLPETDNTIPARDSTAEGAGNQMVAGSSGALPEDPASRDIENQMPA